MKVLMNSSLVLLMVIAYLIPHYVDNISVVAQDIDSSFGITTPMYVSTNGTVTSTRVIDVSTDHPKTETSFTEDAIIHDVGNVSNTGTYIATIESSNTTKGIGQGIITSDESNNMVAWNAYDLGKRIDNATTFVFNGIIFFNVLPPHDGSNEFMFLDDRVGLYRSEVNDTGSTREIWTWD
jgi:hypothetical protein